MSGRLLILFIIMLCIDWYAFQAVRYIAQDVDRNIRLLIYGIYWLVPLIAIGYTLVSIQGETASWPKIVTVSITAMLFILYLSKLVIGVVLLIDDIRRLVMWVAGLIFGQGEYSVGRSEFLTKMSLALGALPFVSLTYGMIRNPYRYKVFEEEIDVDGLPDDLDGFRIVQISDIHAGSFLFKEPVWRSVELINSLNPDIAFFTGDLVNAMADEADDYIDVFGAIRSRHGVFSILGNHDYGDYHEWDSEEAKSRNFEKLKEQHKRMGWNLLLNENRVIRHGSAALGVIGVENYSTNPRFPKYGDLNEAKRDIQDSDFNVLLSHDPSHWDEIAGSETDIDLTLSGHTHGFQFGVEIPGYVKWSPVQYVYKNWAGLYQYGKQFLYVNRGLGYLGYPGRVGILPEITLLTLRKAVRN